MQIAIFNDSGNDVLVHGPLRASGNYGTGPIGEIGWENENQVEIARGLRWPRAQVYERGNRVCACTFAAIRQFATPFAVLAWQAQHLMNVRMSHTLKLQDQGGVITLTGGALAPIRSRPLGVEVQLFYRFWFSGVTTS